MYTLNPGLGNIYFYTVREPNIYKPYGFFLGFLTTLHLCVFFVFSSFLFFFCDEITYKGGKEKKKAALLVFILVTFRF